MKHKPFDSWILDAPDLDESQRRQLDSHLAKCPQCQKLFNNWQSSYALLLAAPNHQPSPGFTTRWSKMAENRRMHERSHQIRRTLLIMAMVAVIGWIVYAIQNNLLISWLVSAVSIMTSLIVTITKTVNNIQDLVFTQPEVLIGVGFLLFGAFIAFLGVFFFTLWNAKNEVKVTINEN